MPRASANGVPGSAAGPDPSRRMPAASWLRPSSFPEHSIPFDSTPFIRRLVIVGPSGSAVPTVARGTRSPTEKFVAPHTTSTVSPPPASTVTRWMWVGRGYGRDLEHPGNHHTVEPLAHALDAVDDQTEIVEGQSQFGGIGLDGREITEPGQGDAHGGSSELGEET